MGDLVLSLFPGADLLGVAFELEGFCVVTGPDVIFGRDNRNFHPPAGKFDGVIGGPPCQEFSPLVHMLRATGREPRHRNMIPEFERCVLEAQPVWFLMENVPPAPLPSVEGYGTSSLLLCPTWIGESGLGHEQRRVRRFTFGVLDQAEAPDLRRWIRYAALELPEASPTVTQSTIDNTPEAKGRIKTLTITGNARQVPVRYGIRMKLSEMCELQGLPPDFLAEAPFTMDGKRRVVGNGVALPVGRELARAVRRAMEGR